jgi:hypothetical protein
LLSIRPYSIGSVNPISRQEFCGKLASHKPVPFQLPTSGFRQGYLMKDLNTEKDQDRGKGAVEQDQPQQPGNTSMRGQLGHRDQDPLLKSSDTDFPEPGTSPEHTGEGSRGKLNDVA